MVTGTAQIEEDLKIRPASPEVYVGLQYTF